MKKMTNLTATALAVAIATGAGFSVSQTAQADTSATLSAANMYLWRGQNLTPNGAQFAGSLDYTHGSGFRAGIWASTETGGHETDLYAGYGGAIGEFSYDISYFKYWYPENCSGTPTTCDLGKNDQSDAILAVGFGPVKATAYINVESDTPDDNYFTVDASFGKFNLLYGWWDMEATTATGTRNEYSHFTLSYAATSELKFAVSMLSNDSGFTPEGAAPAGAITDAGLTENPLFMVSYTKSFDL